MQDKPVSLNDIAKACGVSKMSVSRALRRQPKVRADIAEGIRAKAAEMGYQVDPWVSQAMTATRLAHPAEYRETVGFIWTGRDRFGNLEFHGAQSQAERFHFKVDEFTPRGDGLSSRRVDQMLQARGIRGIILSPSADRLYPHYWLPWDRYSCVVVGSSLRNRGLFRVQHDHYRGGIELLKAVRHLGYRRPGFVVSSSFHERTLRCYTAALAAFSDSLQANEDAACLLENWRDPQRVWTWMAEYRPDMLLVESLGLATRLEKLGITAPGTVPMAILGLNHLNEKWAGIYQKCERIGEEAMKALAWKLQNRETGTMADPPVLSIAGSWTSGHSLPAAPGVT